MLFSLFLLAPLGDSEALPRWYPDGPSFKFFPYLDIDEERPWGGECEGCGGKCTGHYITDVDKLLQLNESAKTVRALPPSVLIEEAFKKQQANSNSISTPVLLTTESREICASSLSDQLRA